ncbi:MAG: site-specific DNA-methyltransferase [Dietzia psychralcaliphila]
MTRSNQRLELTWFNKDKALIPAENGKYGYSWVDPRDPRYCQTRPLVLGDFIEGVQAPKQDGSAYSLLADLGPTLDNLLIDGESGDVLEALTRVPELTDEYVGKIKLCYIDPPFNTEKSFTHYEDNLEHSVWLTMMRDRLVHIKKLLADDGSIWVHLDDSENHRMRVLMDEVFGAGNFAAEVVWQKADSPRNDTAGFSISHDVILVYRKSEKWRPNRVDRLASSNTSRYKSRDGDPIPWRDGDATAPGSETHQGMVYGIQHPVTGKILYPTSGRHWGLSQDQMLSNMREYASYDLQELDDAEVRARLCGISSAEVRRGVKAITLTVPLEESARTARERYDAGNWPELVMLGLREKLQRKKHLADDGRVPETIWTGVEVGGSLRGKNEIKMLFPDLHPFDTPKPEQLLERVIRIATNPGDIVLDVFAGSGTTAAVAHKMARRWVTAELLSSTVDTFTLPRLTKVVRGEDQGGITTTAGERVDATEDGLPEGLTPEEAQRLTSLLNKAIKGDDVLKKDSTVSKIKAMVKTKNSGAVVNWRGGGSFRVAHLAPECFDYDPELGLVTLTPAALDGDNLERSVAAHLSFHLTPEHPVFTGVRGRTRLLVIRSAATPDLVAEIVSHLEEEEKVVIASTAVDPDTSQALRQTRKGSRVVHIPNDLFRADEIEG